MIGNVILTNDKGISKSSFDDFNLLMVSKVIEAPEPKLHKVEVPGTDGDIDLSDYLAGEVRFNERPMTLKFRYLGKESTRTALISEFLNFAHGRKTTFNFNDDADYIYIGRMITNVPEIRKKLALDFEINAIVEPFKRDIASSAEEWLWDPFDFELGVINELSTILLPAYQYVGTTIVGTYSDTFTITTTDSAVEVWYDVTPDVVQEYQIDPYWTIPANQTRKIYDARILPGEHWFTFRAMDTNGSVTVDYRGGML